MSASMPSPESMSFDRPLSTSGRGRLSPLAKGLLVYCTTVSICVAAAAALVKGVPADVLLASL